MNWSNKITLLRIMLVPIFMITIIQEVRFLPLIIFFVCMVSDGLDGFVARHYNQKTTLGTFLDPAADKFLLLSAYLMLALTNDLPWWLTIVVLSRDIFIVCGWIVIYFLSGSTRVYPKIFGKVSTFFQMTTIILVLISKYFIPIKYLNYFYYATVFFAIASGIDYLYYNAKYTSSKE
jgi:cardiolipin synthase (CMP-forming)